MQKSAHTSNTREIEKNTTTATDQQHTKSKECKGKSRMRLGEKEKQNNTQNGIIQR